MQKSEEKETEKMWKHENMKKHTKDMEKKLFAKLCDEMINKEYKNRKISRRMITLTS